MAAQQDVDIDAMDWGPGVIEIGTQEAEEAMTALVSAAVKVDGASAGPSTETKLDQLWRCGTLRSTSPSAVPLLRLAVKHADERYVLRELHCAQCCDACCDTDTAPFVHLQRLRTLRSIPGSEKCRGRSGCHCRTSLRIVQQ